MKNKKGFTLIELLAVVALIALLSLLVVPSVITIVNKNKPQLSSATEKLILTATEMYLDANQTKFIKVKNAVYCPTVQDLIDNGFLEKNLIDVTSGEEYASTLVIKSSYTGYRYEYEIVNSAADCEEVFISVEEPIIFIGDLTFAVKSKNVNSIYAGMNTVVTVPVETKNIEDGKKLTLKLRRGSSYISGVNIQKTVSNSKATFTFQILDTYSPGEYVIEVVDTASAKATKNIKLMLNWQYNSQESEIGTDCYSYTGAVQTFQAPVSGEYTFEVWGAQGGSEVTTVRNITVGEGGKGGYSEGTLYLDSGTNLFIYVGGQGICKYGYTVLGGFNGGGNISTSYSTRTTICSGGGATDIRIGEDSLYSRVIVAGGGGGSSPDRYSDSAGSCYATAGDGGGTAGGRSYFTYPGTSSCGVSIDGVPQLTFASGATLTESGQIYCTYGSDSCNYSNGGATFGQGAQGGRSYSSGGGGWFGGSSGLHTGGSGGSGWVYTEANYQTVASAVTNFSSKWLLTSQYYLSNTEMQSGVREGDGEACITYEKTASQEFEVPYSAKYKLRLWNDRSHYVEAETFLSEGTKLYITVTEAGETGTLISAANDYSQKIIEAPSNTNTTGYVGGNADYGIELSNINYEQSDNLYFSTSNGGYVMIEEVG